MRYLIASDIHGALPAAEALIDRFLEDVSQLNNPRFICWGFHGASDEKFYDVLKTSSRHASGILKEVPVPPFTLNGRPPLEPGN